MLKLCSLLIMTIVSLPVLALPLTPFTSAPLQQHMKEVNAQWEQLENPPDWLQHEVAFANDRQRIKTHLALVEYFLNRRTPSNLSSQQKANRMHHLKVLNSYQKRAVFPLNTDHDERIPYFIDDNGTACAVGYLMIQDGQKVVADAVVAWNNNAYVHAIDEQFEALKLWADAAGFTVDELAWIQPAYAPPITPLSPGFKGDVYSMKVNNRDNVLYIGGSFDELDGDGSFNNIMAYDGNSFNNMGGGANGPIYTMDTLNGNLYVAGSFSAVSGLPAENIAMWDGQRWHTVGAGLNGKVEELIVHNGNLFAVGEFNLSGINWVENVGWYAADRWHSLGHELNGSVNGIASNEDELFISGDFTAARGQSLNGLAYLQGTDWKPVGNGPPCSYVTDVTFLEKALVSPGPHISLFIAGVDTTNGTQDAVFYRWNPDDEGWTDFSTELEKSYGTINSDVNFIKGSGGYFTSWNQLESISTITYLSGILDTIYFNAVNHLTLPMNYMDSTFYNTGYYSISDAPFHAITAYGNRMFYGGAFSCYSIYRGTPEYGQGLAVQPKIMNYTLQHTDSTTGPKGVFNKVGGIYPNPVGGDLHCIVRFNRDDVHHIRLVDLNGRVVYSDNVAPEQTDYLLHPKDLQQGLYLLELRDDSNKLLSTGKLVVQ